MDKVCDALENAGVAFVFLKAAALRDMLYPDPGLRPCTDIDVLINPSDQAIAHSALLAIGGKDVVSNAHSRHECTIALGMVDVDLHWDVLAPGRLPPAMTRQIIKRRVKSTFGWRPDNVDVLLLALVHPAFAKHVCSRHVGLNRAADTLLMLERFNFSQQEFVIFKRRLRDNGVLFGATASIYWLSKISSNARIAQLNNLLNSEVKYFRMRYLRLWIDRDWPDFWVDRNRFLLNIAFTAWLQDTPIRVFFRQIRAKLAPWDHRIENAKAAV